MRWFSVLKRALVVLVLLAAFVYIGDDLSARFPIPKSRNPFQTVQVQPYYAIHLKNKKTEYDFNVPPNSEICVNALFPHFGYRPCWYVKRHTIERLDE